MSALEATLENDMGFAEGLVARALGLGNDALALLKRYKSKVIVDESILGAYDIWDNNYILPSNASFRAKIHEAAHKIKFILDKATRDYFLDPLNRTRESAGHFIEMMNLQETFAKYAELLIAGEDRMYSNWSRIRNSAARLYKKSYEVATHIFGFSSAIDIYRAKLGGGYNELAEGFRNLLYCNTPRTVGIPKIHAS